MTALAVCAAISHLTGSSDDERRNDSVTGSTGTWSGVPKAVASEISLATVKTVSRLFGANRYATAAAVARQCLSTEGFLATEVYITTGLNYPDALSGGMLAGSLGHPLLFTSLDSCPPDLAAFLNEKKPVIGYIWLIGGAGAISSPGAAAIDSVMMN